MHPRLKQAIIFVGAVLASLWLASELATGSYFAPGLAAVIAIGFVLSRLWRLEIDTILLGLALIGYLVGSRGFAQLSLLRGVPLLPAEIALGLAFAWRFIRCAYEKKLPWRGGLLEWALLAWLVLGSARMLFDLPRHGFMAIRDYAMVYYVLLYFIVRHMTAHADARRFLVGCLVSGLVGLALVYPLTLAFPSFFLRQLVIGQVPLIFHKEDIVQTFFAAGGIILFHWAPPRLRFALWPLACLIYLQALASDVRAALVGGLLAVALMAAAGRWRFAVIQTALGTTGLVLLAVLSFAPGQDWAEQRFADITDRAATIFQVDPLGSQHVNKGYKVDNNRFRLVWWRTVATEVLTLNPAFGLGFGADLSAAFLREYDQDMGEEFLARSPHSIVVTALGRMGLVGTGIWACLSVALLLHAWHAFRAVDNLSAGMWAGLLVILISATFGVVLEGPMGAFPFWIMLGLARDRDDLLSHPPLSPPPAPTAALHDPPPAL